MKDDRKAAKIAGTIILVVFYVQIYFLVKVIFDALGIKG